MLINNAGVIQVGPLEHMTHEDFENAMATHFWGPLHLMQEWSRRCAGAASAGSSTSARSAVARRASPRAVLRQQVRAHRSVRCGARGARIARDPRHDRVARTDANGSPPNAEVKGQHEAEYAWFAIADSAPGLSISAERAARQIMTPAVTAIRS